MENPRHEEQNIIKDVRDLFWLEKQKKETIATTIKDIRNLFRLEKENEVIKGRIIRDIRKAFSDQKKKIKQLKI